MSDMLSPYVATAHEITKGGHLLMATYAPAFTSYSEMSIYRQKIIKILDAWGSRFLLGDVGFNRINYANWGMLAGSPVCIDYAYIFPVSMDLFKCYGCNNKTMVMNSSFSEYTCTNCGRKYEDSSLRATITQQERLKLFSSIEGLEMHEPVISKEVEVDSSDMFRNNPDMPDPYETAFTVANMLMNNGRIRNFDDL
jgi:hypothetical protein